MLDNKLTISDSKKIEMLWLNCQENLENYLSNYIENFGLGV